MNELSITAADLPNDGGWHHVALVVDDSSRTLYVDGERLAP